MTTAVKSTNVLPFCCGTKTHHFRLEYTQFNANFTIGSEMILIFLLVCSFISHGLSQDGVSWKDDWLRQWERKAVAKMNSYKGPPSCISVAADSLNCTRLIPIYLPARINADYSQIIPMVIWQTWKSVQASGPNHYAAVMSFINHNPEYEYYMFDDEAALEFMCTFYPEQSLIYQQVVPGAAKADLWRLGIMARYGGVYFDTDSESITPLRNIIWQNASVVSGLGCVGDFHQWALIYPPRHIIIEATFKFALKRLKELYNKHEGGDIVTATGPGALSAGVDGVLQMFNCTPLLQLPRSQDPQQLVQVVQRDLCVEGVGIMQIYSGDYLGNNVIFKHKNANEEKNAVSLYYQNVEHNFDTLFREVPQVLRNGTKIIGRCQFTLPKHYAKYPAHRSTHSKKAAHSRPSITRTL